MAKENKKYLIIGPSWVGDLVMAQSLFMDIKQREPDAIIDVLGPEWAVHLIERMPEVRALVPVRFEHGQLLLLDRIKTAKEIRKQKYDHAIVLPNSLKSALVPWLARISKRTGFLGEQRYGILNDRRVLDKAKLPMTVQRFIALGLPKSSPVRKLESIPKPRLMANRRLAEYVMAMHGLNLDKPLLVLCPGAEFGPSKQWPVSHYAVAAIHYIKKGWQVWILGSERDAPICRQINGLVYKSTNQLCDMLAGKTTLSEAIDLLSLSKLVISNDSGLMHIAAALGQPVVAVYGSSDPSHTPPLSSKSQVVRLGLECSPCFKRVCPLNHLDCLQNLRPQTVISAAEKLLK